MPPAGATSGREVSRRRAEAMRSFFPKLASGKADETFLAWVGEVERYLTQARDLVDLRRRIGDIERRAVPPRGSP